MGDLCVRAGPRVYGAGDGNRTHVRSLGSFYTAIVRRPLYFVILLTTSRTYNPIVRQLENSRLSKRGLILNLVISAKSLLYPFPFQSQLLAFDFFRLR
jgi:hypothetical protein